MLIIIEIIKAEGKISAIVKTEAVESRLRNEAKSEGVNLLYNR